MTMLIKWVLFALLIMFIAWVVPGISISSFSSAMFVVVILSLVNIFIRPLINFVSLPLNVITLGIFSLVINALLFLLVAKFSPGFQIEGFFNGMLGAIILSVLSPIVEKVQIRKK